MAGFGLTMDCLKSIPAIVEIAIATTIAVLNSCGLEPLNLLSFKGCPHNSSSLYFIQPLVNSRCGQLSNKPQ
jgi:hypothetical protein